jgi:hypothetical protein
MMQGEAKYITEESIDQVRENNDYDIIREWYECVECGKVMSLNMSSEEGIIPFVKYTDSNNSKRIIVNPQTSTPPTIKHDTTVAMFCSKKCAAIYNL